MNVALPATFNVLSLFSGGGGLDLGIRLAVPRSRVVGYVEREAYAAAVLVARMGSQDLDPAPVWDDVVTFNGRPFCGLVDCVAGGFPCQDISNAGQREGIEGSRSGLWLHFARIIREVQPSYVFVENVAALAVRGLDVVLGDLASLWFDAEWGVLGADSVGAPHQRDRLFILAHTRRDREQRLQPEPEQRSGGAPAFSGAGENMVHASSPVQRRERWGDGEVFQQAGPAAASASVADSAGECQRESDDAPGSVSRQRARFHAGGRGGYVAHANGSGRSGERSTLPIDANAYTRNDVDRCGGALAYVADADIGTGHGLHERVQLGHMASDAGVSGLRCAPFPPGPDDREGWEAYLREWPGTEPAVRRGADGLAHRMERLRLLGNGVVPQQAAAAFGLPWRRLHE